VDALRLVAMANRIAEFFAGMPDRAEAVAGVAMHLRQFWEPAMRAELLVHVSSAGSDGLHPLLAEALEGLREN
jgi:formate dehydrogenase subunit delta